MPSRKTPLSPSAMIALVLVAAVLPVGNVHAKSAPDCVNKLVGPDKNIMLYADTSRGRPFSKDPDVVNFKGKYYMYYSIPPYRDGRKNDGWSIGIARSDDKGKTWYISKMKVEFKNGKPRLVNP